MPVTLKCPKCKTTFRASRDVLGNLVNCPGCQREFRAPTPEKARAKLAAKRAAREAAVLGGGPQPAAVHHGGNLPVWILSVLGCLVAVAVLVVVGLNTGPGRVAAGWL